MEKRERGAAAEVIRTGLVLLVIAVVIALLLSVVNGFSAPLIAKNETAEKMNAIAQIFPQADGSALTGYQSDAVSELYTVTAGGEEIGYCCVASGSGFADDIVMMIGVNRDLTVKSIQILTISDTPGIGLKVDDAAFLAAFAGASGKVAYGETIDAITGATYSSAGVLEGVNAALSACTAYAAEAQTEAQTNEEGGTAA